MLTQPVQRDSSREDTPWGEATRNSRVLTEGCDASSSRTRGLRGNPAPEEAAMEEQFVWTTTRRIKPGTLPEFEQAWRPEHFPEGLRRAYAYWSEDQQEVIGVSFWDSKESCDAWRAAEGEARRREAMAPYVLDEREAFYRGRELAVPTR
jgi:heme-degrading monooxygenase HmoA